MAYSCAHNNTCGAFFNPLHGNPSSHYADVDEEPMAPTLSLGNRILWLTESRAASGIVRWIGRIPSLSSDWSAGIEFDNAMPGGSNGSFQGRPFFVARPGHAVFLPITAVLKVDSNPATYRGERTSFFGRLQDSYSNFAQRRRRDSTFGHFKQECPSTYVHNCHGQHYGHAPVYDRITTRPSLRYNNQPYAIYDVCDPCNSQQNSSRDVGNQRQENPRHCEDHAWQYPGRERRPVVQQPYVEALEDTKDKSIFNMNPRASFGFISTFKDWVSCVILGTNRRKAKKIVLTNKKSVTNVFMTQNSNVVTGQRLSSCSEYATVFTKARTETPDLTSKRWKSRKKRPAPLPPPLKSNIQHESQLNSTQNVSNTREESTGSSKSNLKRVDSRKKHKTSEARSQPVKTRKMKKRLAPPPPLTRSEDSFPEYAAVVKKGKKLKEVPSTKPPEISHFYPMSFDRLPNNMHGSLPQRNHDWRWYNDHVPDSDLGDLEDSSSGSFSLSSDDVAEDKYGRKSCRRSHPRDGSGPSDYVQYSGKDGDVCLKISIEKTETNVVTVEEVPAQRTVHYTIEEDTTTSGDISDEPLTVIEKHRTDVKPTTTDSSSVSAEESEKSKTIFDELQMKPPVRGSVRDFVHAFNLLAHKGKDPALASQNHNLNSSVGNSQGASTTWEYANNALVPNLIHPANSILHSIVEEPINEISDVEEKTELHSASNSSAPKTNEASDRAGKRAPTPHAMMSDKCQNTSGNDVKKCSHCLEKHAQKDCLPPKSIKKRVAPKKPPLHHEFRHPPLKKELLSLQASVAAVTSLLNDREPKDHKPRSSNISDLKADKPIMVGLYIEDKCSHRGPMPLLIRPSMPLMKLKKQIEGEYGFPAGQQCWILGESFAVQEERSLASYGVSEPGYPILLYVMSQDARAKSLPSRFARLVVSSSESSEEGEGEKEKIYKKVLRKSKGARESDQSPQDSVRSLPKITKRRQKLKSRLKEKGEPAIQCDEDTPKKGDYRILLALDDVDLVSNVEQFECPICFLDVDPGQGAVLQECLHCFCRECLASAVQFSETAVIKCPFRNEEYSCESHLQEREIKCLVNAEAYERHLGRSMALAESQAPDSFHCRTPDCPGWCLYEDNVNTFKCPVCGRTNCLTCAAVHEGRNCRQFQDDLAFRCDTSDEAKKTRELLQSMVRSGEAMECPQCQVILMKKWGCDWLKCSVCHAEVCWVTKGPRWGPAGKGDTSAGCKCMVNGTRCHPKCSYCH